MIHELLKCVFQLLRDGQIRSISPIKTFGFNNIAAAFAFMRGGRHIGKIVITNGLEEVPKVPVRPALKRLLLRDDVSYLIVGGLKGLCGSLAVYMAQHGAKHIISMSRSCQVHEAKGDVSDIDHVRKAFKSAEYKIGGLIQGAMVLREYHITISNKVRGTWNLHEVALEEKLGLDFFTMLSSISGVVGQKGQTNYAAANVFLDAFAKYRRSLNLAANSTDLGVIEDMGYVAEQGGMEQHFDRRQWTYINESVLHKILSYSILQQTSPINSVTADQLLTGISVPLPEDSDLFRDARFAGLAAGLKVSGGRGQAGGGSSKDKEAFLLLHRAGAAPMSILASVLEIVNKQFMKTLRLDAPMEPAKALSTYGLDSLLAVEFRNWVRQDLTAELTLLDITNAPSLYALCERIIAKIPAAAAPAL
ncbi:hypothetical protein ACEPPN_007841 [Leptodophora sp. 'Broadleaf-Isolate-01']